MYHEIAGKLAECDDKIDGEWDETDAAMGRVVLGERAYVRAVIEKHAKK